MIYVPNPRRVGSFHLLGNRYKDENELERTNDCPRRQDAKGSGTIAPRFRDLRCFLFHSSGFETSAAHFCAKTGDAETSPEAGGTGC